LFNDHFLTFLEEISFMLWVGDLQPILYRAVLFNQRTVLISF